MSAWKYSYAREISPLNKAIQAVPFEHAHMNKLRYVESPKCLPEGCTQLRTWQTLRLTPGEMEKMGRGAERKAEELPAGKGWALQVSSQARKHLRSAKRCKRTVRVAAFRLLVTTSHFVPTSVEQCGDKCAVQPPGRERVFHEEIFTPAVYADTSNLYHTTVGFSS